AQASLSPSFVFYTASSPKLCLLSLHDALPISPVPLKLTACGLPLPLSVMLTLATRLPVAVGLNVTLIVQLALSASVAGLTGQLLVWAKSPELDPAMPILLIVIPPVPFLVKVTF